MKLVFATNNRNKLKELSALLPKTIELVSLEDIGCEEDIEETEVTLEGNAMLKANFIKSKYGLNCFADDTGLEVEALNGAPGVFSARYAGDNPTFDDNMDKLLKELSGKDNRRAKFRTVISLLIGDKNYLFEGMCEGVIQKEKTGELGFGYDPIFRPAGFKKSFAEMTLREKGVISHRGIATKKLIQFLENYKDGFL